ncbi:FAD-dependent oxidoreductase [Streptomyces sp. 6N223]|uniref:FAD-dependent oxidoreductase n=1 Tax=Streptomyces sp. 6N223 TaxID=3457412 RepID=UPI003FD45C08
MRGAAAESADVVVVGGGPAGLLAAHLLGSAGLTVVLVEAADRPGGRMATERRDGFRLDRGSQPLLNNHRPELNRLPRPLPLSRLTGGVLLRGATRSHRVGAVTESAENAADRPERSRAFDQFVDVRPRGRRARRELSTAAALRVRGVPGPVAEYQLRPLLTALLGDPELASSSRLGDLRLRAFARRGIAVPAPGTPALPELLAAALPETVALRTGRRAVAVATTAVETEPAGGGPRATVRCRAVVVATGAAEAARLLPGLRMPAHRPATVLHHAAPAAALGAPEGGPTLIVDAAGRGPVAHTLHVSAADPARAPAGWGLVTSVVLGPRSSEPPELLDKAARPQLAELHQASAEDWELLDAHHDPLAVPVVPPPYTGARRVRLLDGLYVCGDHRDVPGLPGDLASARRAAESLLTDAGLRPASAEPAEPAAPAPAPIPA